MVSSVQDKVKADSKGQTYHTFQIFKKNSSSRQSKNRQQRPNIPHTNFKFLKKFQVQDKVKAGSRGQSKPKYHTFHISNFTQSKSEPQSI